MRLNGIIFDLDGTLGNTIPICLTAFRLAFEKFLGHCYSDQQIKALFGPSEEGIMQQLVPDQWQACLETYIAEYEQAHHSCREPFGGIKATLDLLKERGVELAVVTGKGRRSAEISLKHLGLASYFDLVEVGSVEGDTKATKIQDVLERWRMLPENAAYVGDSPSDMEVARKVGVAALAAAWDEMADEAGLVSKRPLEVFPDVESFIGWIRHNVVLNRSLA